MGKAPNKTARKRFKKPSQYRWSLLSRIFFVVVGAVAVWYMFSSPELYLSFINRDPGSLPLGYKGSSLPSLLLGAILGRTGLGIVFIAAFLLFCYQLYSEIAEYRRYREKHRLYPAGLAEDDIYDDYAPPALWQLLKSLPGNLKMKWEVTAMRRRLKRKHK
jgi:hypothetical protein